MRLDAIMTSMLVQLDGTFAEFVRSHGTSVVELDKALYGCVEAAALWYEDLHGTLTGAGFVENPYDVCVFNKADKLGVQTTVAVHVDDLMCTSVSQTGIDGVKEALLAKYPEITVREGKVLDYVGMTFDFREDGQVRITMDNCVNEILGHCGEVSPRATPATSCLFDVRDDAQAATELEREWFHTNTAKMLYMSKRVRPECLTAVSFLTTRVQHCDYDDLAKLRRVLGYVLKTRERGIVLRIGGDWRVHGYVDASYSVHTDRKSHTGCAVTLGCAGPVYSASTKQKIVTKSTAESELVGLSDSGSVVIHLRNFVGAQGYDMPPAKLHEDNMSCMALVKRGGPASGRSRHIDIRYFWLRQRVDDGEVAIEHLPTEQMFANVLTKPLQGEQFRRERQGLTNWE
jgi:hypothetical protein